MFKNSQKRTATALVAALTVPFLFAAQASAQSYEPAGKISIAEAPAMRVVAEVRLAGGKISFVDETIDGVFGLGILEVGKVNLASFYEHGATALEIFLALAPAGSSVPEELYRAHENARRLDPGIPDKPRTIFNKAVTAYAFSQDTDECWQWGGGDTSDYAGAYGYPYHSNSSANYAFIDWSQIDDSSVTSTVSYLDEDTVPAYEISYATPFGIERAVAMCVTHAETPDQTSTCPSGNTVNYRVRLKGESLTTSWYSDWEYLTAYGDGVRYRSSSSGRRKYTLEVFDISTKSIHCQEKFEVRLRSRDVPPRAD